MFGNLVDATGEASANDMRAREGVGAASIGALTALSCAPIQAVGPPRARRVAHLRAAARIQAVSTIQISELNPEITAPGTSSPPRHHQPRPRGLYNTNF